MWGEPENTPTEINQPVDLSSVMEQSRLKDCLSMYQINSCVNETREVSIPPMDSRLLYGASLHQYMAKMTDVIEDAELAVEYNLVMPSEMPAIAIPEPPDVKPTMVLRKPIHFIDKEYSAFAMGFGKNPQVLSESTRKQIEAKCIATMFAHIGLINTNTTVLEVLVDVFETFMKNICNDLRSANDSLLTGEPSGFPDIVEKVLTQNGLGGIRGICDYYQKRIKKYEGVLKERCQTVVARYDQLLAPVNMQMECKTERVDEMDSEDIPEVHLTSMDGEEGYLQPFLESGFQMLNSLEEGQYVT